MYNEIKIKKEDFDFIFLDEEDFHNDEDCLFFKIENFDENLNIIYSFNKKNKEIDRINFIYKECLFYKSIIKNNIEQESYNNFENESYQTLLNILKKVKYFYKIADIKNNDQYEKQHQYKDILEESKKFTNKDAEKIARIWFNDENIKIPKIKDYVTEKRKNRNGEIK